MNDLSKLMPVKPDQGKAQWVEGKITGIANDEATRMHLVGFPPLMSYTIRFRANCTRHLRIVASGTLTLTTAALLSACSLGGLTGPYPGVPELRSPGRAQPYTGEVAAPQVAYRIDENRYFEIVPRTQAACHTGDLYYVDARQAIRTHVSLWAPGYNLRSTFIIDAANDQYLVAPIVRGNTDCSSGGGLCGGSKLPYSTDGGRTWRRVSVPFTYGPIDAIGANVHVSTSNVRIEFRETSRLDLSTTGAELKDWQAEEPRSVPAAKSMPMDQKFHCTSNGKE